MEGCQDAGRSTEGGFGASGRHVCRLVGASHGKQVARKAHGIARERRRRRAKEGAPSKVSKGACTAYSSAESAGALQRISVVGSGVGMRMQTMLERALQKNAKQVVRSTQIRP